MNTHRFSDNGDMAYLLIQSNGNRAIFTCRMQKIAMNVPLQILWQIHHSAINRNIRARLNDRRLDRARQIQGELFQGLLGRFGRTSKSSLDKGLSVERAAVNRKRTANPC